MASRLLLMLRHPWKTLAFSWMSIRFLILAIADRLLFPFACRPVSLYTEITRCLLGSSLACFLELTFSAPPGLRADEYRPVELNNVSTIVVPRETKLESLGSAETPRTLVLLYAHGGGYLFGEPLMYMDSYKRWIKEAESVGIRLVVVSVDYRGLTPLQWSHWRANGLLGLTTSAKFPAYRDDFITVYQALLDMAISSRNIFFAGDSAGGPFRTVTATDA
jgi:acetyl esterase/lipase